MRDTTLCRWQRWRVALVEGPADTQTGRFIRRPLAPAATSPDEPGADTTPPGADGIRHDLVARVRREIEAGTYETEEKWLAAEERLLRRAESGR